VTSTRPDVRDRIEHFLRRLQEKGDTAAVTEATGNALGDRHYLVVNRAAEVAGDRLLYDLEPELVTAYRRLLDNPAKKDPNCMAKGAITRALVTLDCQDASFFLAAIRYRQPEPVWGGTVDTAVDLRTTCAIGLVNTSYPRALVALVELLHDPEPNARGGAARAIACTEPLAAEAVLRCKALAGDPEPGVVGDCLAGLLKVAPEESIGFVRGFLDHDRPAIAELAALALGESRLEAALDLLRERWECQPLKREADRSLLRAAVIHRSEPAFDWLLSVAERGDRESAELVVVELATYRTNQELRRRLRDILIKRHDPHLLSRFDQAWGPPKND
jgi:HEAT repeat protein